MRYLVVLTLAAMLLAGCTTQKHTVGGAALGGIGGGVIGSQIGKGTGQTAAIIGGTLLGAALGGYVGSYMDRMDEMDRRNMNQTLETKPTGTTSQWHNPDTQTDYAVTPTETYQRDDGRYCREYTTEVQIGGETEKAYGTACRRDDGAWEIIN
ncbi:RT0821/Lpp0805 family surface protein [Desulfonatronospira sp. MSAO_Bac3]|uniref:RT0821/Lpp0805 family surface protein n=1 Tax=Desulfonatronospira sp. MSAO_Bac3 TaxID=2293857 RepID=UPI000FF6626C|nr:RT0821/Lpp0805 family surface protein [Desulfonatronospira sp. MSAO_Bac3]RQD77936.1 MAG: glycine zipper 2TM domain-containing protein [Desulfonatronospira sp. MSAO_Bac3]